MDNNEEKLNKMMPNITNRSNISLEKINSVKFDINSFNLSKTHKSHIISNTEIFTKNHNFVVKI